MGKPSQDPLSQGDLYRVPVCHNVPLAFVPVLGSLAAALEWISNLAQNKTPIVASSKLRHRSIAQINYGKALGRYKASCVLIETSL
ncbi:MAG: hypothetical protein O2968_15365 [Acidobacteria bacterium]|nr:hypothetical protein [Acidobacteriota bacterium]